MSILKEFIQENIFRLLDKAEKLDFKLVITLFDKGLSFYSSLDNLFCKFYFEKDLISINGIDEIDEICNIETFIKLWSIFDNSAYFKEDEFLSYLRDELEIFMNKKEVK